MSGAAHAGSFPRLAKLTDSACGSTARRRPGQAFRTRPAPISCVSTIKASFLGPKPALEPGEEVSADVRADLVGTTTSGAGTRRSAVRTQRQGQGELSPIRLPERSSLAGLAPESPPLPSCHPRRKRPSSTEWSWTSLRRNQPRGNLAARCGTIPAALSGVAKGADPGWRAFAAL